MQLLQFLPRHKVRASQPATIFFSSAHQSRKKDLERWRWRCFFCFFSSLVLLAWDSSLLHWKSAASHTQSIPSCSTFLPALETLPWLAIPLALAKLPPVSLLLLHYCSLLLTSCRLHCPSDFFPSSRMLLLLSTRRSVDAKCGEESRRKTS